MLHTPLLALSLLPFVPASQQAARTPWTVPSPDGEASVLVLEGQHARQVVGGGLEVASGSSQSALLGGACAPLVDSFLSSDPGAEGDGPSAIAFTPDAARFVVANLASRNLTVFDAATQTVVGTIALSGSPAHVAISADNVHAVTANLFEDTASIVDLNSLSEVAVVPVGDQPAFVRVTPGGGTAVVGNAVDQSLSVIDIATASELQRISGAGFAATTSIAFEPGVVAYRINGFECPSDTLAVHPDSIADEIDFFDLAAGTVSSLPCDADPRGIAMTPDGATVVVSHMFATRRVTVVDTATQSIAKVLTTTADLNEPIGVRPDGGKVAVSIQNATLVLDVASGASSPSLNTASVNGYLPTPDGNHVLCVGFRGSLISWSTQSIVKELNNVVSTAVGAHAPSGQRAAMAANLFGEDLLVVNTNGAAGFLEAHVPSGAPPEADATRKVAVSADGTRAVSSNILSDTASVIDLTTGTVLAVVDVGDRPADVEITPDGSKAVVANLDSTFASVIDLSTFAVTNVPISTRGSEVEISPDGHYAYVAVLSGGDGVWRIDLTTNSVAGAKLPTTDMGGVLYLYNQTSGMTLSHDGLTLAVCGSFSDAITLIDTQLWALKATVLAGDFPTAAAFSPDDSRLYVANKDSDTVSVFNSAGGALGTIAVGDQPWQMAVSPDGARLYVCNFGSKNVGVVNLTTGVQFAVLPVVDSPQGLALSPSGSCLTVSSGNWTVSLGPGPKLAIGLAGAVRVFDTAALTAAQSIDTGLPPGGIDFDASGAVGLVPSPFGDGLTRLDGGSGVVTYCTASTTSLPGCQASISGVGTPSVSAPNGFTIHSGAVPGNNVGILYFGDQGQAAIPMGTQGGFVCAIPGFRAPGKASGGTTGVCNGAFAYTLAELGFAGPLVITPGNTLNAGFWFRDSLSPDTFGLSNGIEFTLQP